MNDDEEDAEEQPTNNSVYQTETEWIVYPNPTASELSITNSTNQTIDELWVIDVVGRQVTPVIVDQQSSKHVIDVSQFAIGVYFVLIQSGEVQETLRFVKQ